MNVRQKRSGRRRGQVMPRIVLGLGALVAAGLGYLISGGGRSEAMIVPAVVMALLLFAVVLYDRARMRREWSAAWDAYARQESDRKSTGSRRAEAAWSLAASNR